MPPLQMPVAHTRMWLLLRAAQGALQKSIPALQSNGTATQGVALTPFFPGSLASAAAAGAGSPPDGERILWQRKAGLSAQLAHCKVSGHMHYTTTCSLPAHVRLVTHTLAHIYSPAPGDGMREIALTDSDGTYRNLLCYTGGWAVANPCNFVAPKALTDNSSFCKHPLDAS